MHFNILVMGAGLDGAQAALVLQPAKFASTIVGLYSNGHIRSVQNGSSFLAT